MHSSTCREPDTVPRARAPEEWQICHWPAPAAADQTVVMSLDIPGSPHGRMRHRVDPLTAPSPLAPVRSPSPIGFALIGFAEGRP